MYHYPLSLYGIRVCTSINITIRYTGIILYLYITRCHTGLLLTLLTVPTLLLVVVLLLLLTLLIALLVLLLTATPYTPCTPCPCCLGSPAERHSHRLWLCVLRLRLHLLVEVLQHLLLSVRC